MRVMSDRNIQTNKVEQVDLKPCTSKLKPMTLTMAVFCRGGYWKCHTFMAVDNTV